MASVYPWLTLRGLHTDRLEGFSADLRLTFRGLPAEGLGVHTHVVASFPFPPASTNGVLGLLPQEGLSWAARGTSSPKDRVVRGTAGSYPPISYPLENASATVGAGAFLEMVGRAVGLRTVLVPVSIREGCASVGGSIQSAVLNPQQPG